MNISGVTCDELNIIKSILSNFKDKYKFFLYGSRVKGNFSTLSDLDLLIQGENITNFSDIETLKTLFDNSNLPYIVNISDYNTLDINFYNLIKKDLVEL